MMRQTFVVALAIGCGAVHTATDSGVDATDGGVDAMITITSIAVTPLSKSVTWPDTQQLMAMATFSDGTVKDVTATATWTTSDPAVATVSAAGLVTTNDTGTATIQAMVDIQHAEAVIAIAVPTLAVSSFGSAGIDFFPANAIGNVAPRRSIRGAATTFVNPRGMAVIDQELFVVDQATKAIDVFPLAGAGNLAPTRQITGVATTLIAPAEIVASGNEVFVSQLGSSVLVFPSTANGNVAPTRTLTGAATSLVTTLGVAILNNELYVSDIGGGAGGDFVAVFPVTANGNVVPTRRLIGATTGIAEPQGLMIANNQLYVSNVRTSPNTITVYPATASGDVAPLRKLGGMMAAMLSFPDQKAALGPLLYVANANRNAVVVFNMTDDGDVAPARALTGALTNLSNCNGIVIF
jgi:hypothetical protein